jgi:hypothetical protein
VSNYSFGAVTMGDLMGFSAIEVGGPARVPSQLRVVDGIGGTELEVEGGQ